MLSQDCHNAYLSTDADDGCHYLYIFDELRKQLQFANITKNATCQALDRLEEQSDIISMTEDHYTIFLWSPSQGHI